jgi:arginyl-tRNA synthetase
MVMIEQLLINYLLKAVSEIYGRELDKNLVRIEKTRPEIEGDYTIVVFPILPVSRKSPEQTANEIGEWFEKKVNKVIGFSVIKGFLNLSISNKYWLGFFNSEKQNQ